MDHAMLALCGSTALLALCSALGVGFGSSHAGEDRHASLKEQLLTQVSAGVILSVAWLHILDDAQDDLHGLMHFPAANAGMLAGFLVMSFFHALVHSHQHAAERNAPEAASAGKPWPALFDGLASKSEPLLPIQGVDTAKLVREAGSANSSMNSSSKFHLTEASISFHSVLIGVSFGAMTPGSHEQLILGVVLCLHQSLEGCALGLLSRKCVLTRCAWLRVATIFSLSLPAGVALSLAMKGINSGIERGTAFKLTSGLLNAFAAGNLTHVGVEMIGHELEVRRNKPFLLADPCKMGTQACLYTWQPIMKIVAITVGASAMSVLAIWA